MNVDEYVTLALKYYAAKEYEKALQVCNAALLLDPACSRAYHGRGLIHIQLKRYKDALDDYQVARDLAPNNSKLYADSAEFFYFLNNLEQSGICYRKAIELNTRYISLYQQKTDRLVNDALNLHEIYDQKEYDDAVKKVNLFNPQDKRVRRSSSYVSVFPAYQPAHVYIKAEAFSNNQWDVPEGLHTFNCRCVKCWDP